MLLRPALGVLSPAGSRGRLSVLIFHRVAAGPDVLYPGRLDAQRFDQLLGWIARWFNVLPLDSAVEALAKRQLPSRALSITFDDGYADNHNVAMPLLKRRGMSATFFIATAFLDGGRMWNDTVTEAIRSTPLDSLDAEPLGVPGLGLLPLDSLPARRAAVDTVLAAVKYLHPERRLQVVDELARRARARLPADLMMTSAQVRGMHTAGMQIGAHTCNHPILAVLPPDQARQEIAGSRTALERLLDSA